MSIDAKQRLKVYLREAWLDSWVLHDEIEAVTVNSRVSPGVSDATLLLRYGTIKQPWASTFAPVVPANYSDWFVQVRISGTPEVVIFTGVIEAHGQEMGGLTAAVESGDLALTAYGLEHLLDRVQIYGAYARPADDNSDTDVAIGWCPNFNERRKRGGPLLGNRTSLPSATLGLYSFTRTNPESSSSVWTHKDIVQYLLYHYGPLTFNLYVGGQYAAIDALKTVEKLDGLSLRAALNRLIPRSWGLGWKVIINESGLPQVDVFTFLSSDLVVGGVTIPANTNTGSWTLDTDVEKNPVSVRRSVAAAFDRIVVEGARVVTCFSLSYADAPGGPGTHTLTQGWTSDLETAYKAGAGGDDPTVNDEIRTHEKFRPVYARYKIPDDWDGRVKNGENSGTAHYAFPKMNADGTLDAANETRGPELGRAFLRHLPIYKGYDYIDLTGGLPTRIGIEGEDPEFLAPMAFVYDTFFEDPEGTPNARWLFAETADKSENAGKARGAAHVRPDDSGAAIWVKHGVNHNLAKGHWSGANASRVDPDDPVGPADWGTDWQVMVVTVAIETDERVRVIKDVTALGEFGRVLVLQVPEAEMWYLLGGTVVGIADNGTLEHVQSAMMLRDDSATLRLIAELAAKICATERQAVAVTSRTLTDYKGLGVLLTSSMTSALGASVVGVVTSVTWDGRAQTALTRTEFMELDFESLATGLLTTAGYDSRQDLYRAVKRSERAIEDLRRDTGNLDVRREPPGPFEKRYEEFAAAAANYATVDEADQDGTGGGTFDLYRENGDPSGDERRVLIHSDNVYGVRRQIERLLFDIPCGSSLWTRYKHAESMGGWVSEAFGGALYLALRPIIGVWNPTTEEWEGDFDPATITWDGAYGAAPLNFGTQMWIDFEGEFGSPGELKVRWTGMANPPDKAEAELNEHIEVPGLLVTQAVDLAWVIAAWNAEDRIYGWEIAVNTDEDGMNIAWTGADLDSPWARCFVIRP